MTDQETEVREESQDMMEEDPQYTEEQELEQYRENIEALHDMADQVKTVGQDTSELLMDKASETDDEELEEEYLFLANTARQAFRRVEHGDNTIVRNGI